MTQPLDFTQSELAERVRKLDPPARRSLAATAAGRVARECGLQHPALDAARAGEDAHAALAALEAEMDAHDPGPMAAQVVNGELVVPDPPQAWTRAMRAAAVARAHWALPDPSELAGARRARPGPAGARRRAGVRTRAAPDLRDGGSTTVGRDA